MDAVAVVWIIKMLKSTFQNFHLLLIPSLSILVHSPVLLLLRFLVAFSVLALKHLVRSGFL